MKRKFLASTFHIALSLLPATVFAEAGTAYRLGEVYVSGTASDNSGRAAESISQEQIRQQNKNSVGSALKLVPGVSSGIGGARNEEKVAVRGFDLRQVPVFVDGIPVYVPYDGYLDLGRFTTFDLAKIDVEKGFSSMVYGANTLGGAINLVSRRPVETFEGEVGSGADFSSKGEMQGYRVYSNLGSNQGAWYSQLGVSYLDQDYYRLSNSFEPTAAEDGGRRNNSYHSDSKVNVKVGYTPNTTDEYSLNYINQQGEKGSPPYAGTATAVRYWQWPYWNKESLYYISNTAFGIHSLKFRAFHDAYENALNAYDDASYTTQVKKSSFSSWYDDFTNGASLEDDVKLPADNQLKLAYHWKEDVHREKNSASEPERHYKDRTQSVGLEDTHPLSSRLTLVGGISYDWRDALQADDYNSKQGVHSYQLANNDALNGQIGLFQNVGSQGKAHATIARKSRFPTIKDRYSYKLGTAIPNPELKTERANHYEMGYEDVAAENWLWHGNLFYSQIQDLIQANTIDASACTSPPCTQMENVGKSSREGVELGWTAMLESWTLGGNYTYLYSKNISDPGVKLTGLPENTFFTYAQWQLDSQWSLQMSEEAASQRYSSSDGKQVAAGFGVTNFKAGYHATSALLLEVGMNNLFDKLYAYEEGYPEAGRSEFVQFNYQL
jgi:iron complex outermembrane recepter protein